MKDLHIDIKVRVWKSLDPELYDKLTNIPMPHKRGTVMRNLATRGLISYTHASSTGSTGFKSIAKEGLINGLDIQHNKPMLSNDIVDSIDIESMIK